MDQPTSDVTQLLNAWCAGDGDALERLAPLVESELRRIARAFMSRESPGQTLQPTALVNEAYLRLIGWKAGEWQNRAHFYAVAAKLMRRVLVTQAIHRGRQKRGGSAILIPLTDATPAAEQRTADVVALDEALNALAKFDERKSRVVELRFFGGLSTEETAEVLEISPRTVVREWTLARTWLFRELRAGDGGPHRPA